MKPRSLLAVLAIAVVAGGVVWLYSGRSQGAGDDSALVSLYKESHDQFMAAGQISISLIRWEMTGLNNEVREFWAEPSTGVTSARARRP